MQTSLVTRSGSLRCEKNGVLGALRLLGLTLIFIPGGDENGNEPRHPLRMPGMKMHSMPKNWIYRIVGGDAHIAPQQNLPISNCFRQIRTVLQRADVGIGPYGQVFGQSRHFLACGNDSCQKS